MSTVEKDNLVIEYIAQLDSPMIEGEVKANVGENGLVLKVMFEATEILIQHPVLWLRDYVLTVETDFGAFRFSRWATGASRFTMNFPPLTTAKCVKRCLWMILSDKGARKIPFG